MGIGADDLEELDSDEGEYFRLGGEDEEFKDYSSLSLKPDHQNRSPITAYTVICSVAILF